MNTKLRLLSIVSAGFVFAATATPRSNAQIMNAIKVHLDHSFVVDNTTLPPGQYTFRMMHNSDLQLMTVSSPDHKTSVEFIVREAIADHTPNHSELIFRKSGNTEFLNKIFEVGSKVGIAVEETSREEARLNKQGQHGTEHMENGN